MARATTMANRRGASERVGEMVSDSSDSDVSSVAEGGSPSGRQRASVTGAKATAIGKGTAAAVIRTARPQVKRKNSKWYDSDDEDWEETDRGVAVAVTVAPRQRRSSGSSDDNSSSSSDAQSKEDTGGARKSKAKSKKEGDEKDKEMQQPVDQGKAAPRPSKLRAMLTPASRRAEESPRGNPSVATAATTTATATATGGDVGTRRSSLQRLVGKTFNLSPFGAKRRAALEAVASPASSGPEMDTPRASRQLRKLPHGRDQSNSGSSSDEEQVTSTSKSKSHAKIKTKTKAGEDNDEEGGSGDEDETKGPEEGSSVTKLSPPEQQQQQQQQQQTQQEEPPVASEARMRSLSTRRTSNQRPSVVTTDVPARRRTTRLAQSPPDPCSGSGSVPVDSPVVSMKSTPDRSYGPGDALEPHAALRRHGSDLMTSGTDALSPGQRKTPGAFAGRPGSGVLMEGWLRQKQRRGVKGLKKWNARYFVLYARTNEVRYYTDVVPSAWGPIPLGEIGSISLRLIQRISKPSHPKYKSCRFDITCRNTWGTHYADEYVSSEDENNANGPNANQEEGVSSSAATTAVRAGDKAMGNANTNANATPKASRVYSLMADSPQTTVAWVHMLDSLLVRSANSPRVDVSNATGNAHSTSTTTMNGGRSRHNSTTKMATRRRSSTMDMETMVLTTTGDHIPRAVLSAINYIFDSSPGIETRKFYLTESNPTRLRAALKYLNHVATGDITARKSELERVLDPVTAGAVVLLWLKQMEAPIVPYEMHADFAALAQEAKSAAFDTQRSLKALIKALPARNFAMLACLLFHLNDVTEYASKNGMDAATLTTLFADFILRPRGSVTAAASSPSSPTPTPSRASGAEATGPASGSAGVKQQATHALVEEMITNVDAIIDEKEHDLLERV